MNIFITGSTGISGKLLVNKLIENNSELILFLLIRSPEKIPDKWKNKKNIIFIYGSLNNFVISDTIKIDVVVHLAAYTQNQPKDILNETNIAGVKFICDYFSVRQPAKFIYISSAAVINGLNINQTPDKIYSDDLPYCAKDDYGISKIEGEKIILSYKTLNAQIFRPAYLFDEQKYFSVITKRMKSLRWKFIVGKKKIQMARITY